MLDPRPLTGEPLALDLVNTVWIDDAGTHDLLDDPQQRAAWFAQWSLPEAGSRSAIAHVTEARTAIRAVLEDPTVDTEAALDAILGRGRLRLSLHDSTLEVAPSWEAAWHAANDLRDLLADLPDRVKNCANPDCVLWFADTTRSGTRRWCSMTGGCGSRLKARRHAQRIRNA
jgi:predicted RNA-binding Zn ribbon-like protein